MHASAPRASVLRLAGAALVAALVALAGCSGSSVGPPPPPPCRGIDQPCSAGGECCSGDCTAAACGCSALSERCGTSADCCDVGSPRRCEGGACVAGARPIGDVCDWDGQCATFNCDPTGHCAPTCLGAGAGCSSSQQCCQYYGCGAGTCTTSCKSYGSCTTDNECCSGYGCRVGQCQAGVCGTSGQSCSSNADCCTAAQGGKNYFCNGYGQCDLGRPGSYLGEPPDACTTDADCAGTYPCRDGFCHWQDGTEPDGAWCLDGQECAGGSCTSTTQGVPGTCCSGVGSTCVAGGSKICCGPYTCTGPTGAQHCGTCLDFGNSGLGTGVACTTSTQCCQTGTLACVQGKCCTQTGSACTAGSGTGECCFGSTCGSVTTYSGTASNVCCRDYGSSCGAFGGGSCCDGLLCTSNGTCLKAPGQPCSGDGQCADGEQCDLSAGKCCSHPSGPCKSNADCCSNSCDTGTGRCNAVPEYGSCLSEADCYGPDYNQEWNGQVCGGSASLPSQCCPVPGDTCRSQADCCEASDLCQVPDYVDPYGSNPDPNATRCCRPTQADASQDYECCTGMAERRSSTSVVYTCCAYPWMTSFTCASDADCCDGTGYTPSNRCDVGGTNRCCRRDSRSCPGAANAAQCCTGRVDNTGCCTLFRG